MQLYGFTVARETSEKWKTVRNGKWKTNNASGLSLVIHCPVSVFRYYSFFAENPRNKNRKYIKHYHRRRKQHHIWNIGRRRSNGGGNHNNDNCRSPNAN
jgi:hypothetical protein